MDIVLDILGFERRRIKNGALKNSRKGACRYGEKLNAALKVLREFDDKTVDDIGEIRESFEATGVVTCLVTTDGGYMALVSSDNILLATCLPAVTEQ